MFVNVKLLNCASKTFTYSVPKELNSKIFLGTLVQVPIQNRISPAIVCEFFNEEKIYDFIVRPIHSIYPFPNDKNYESLIYKISDYYQTDSLYLFSRIQKFLEEKEEKNIY